MNNIEFWLLMAACIVLLIITISLHRRLEDVESFCGLLCEIAFSDGDLKDLKKHGIEAENIERNIIDFRDDQSKGK